MTLFDECKEALFVDFNIVSGDEEKKLLTYFITIPSPPAGFYGKR